MNLDKRSFDYLIIGGGIIGLSVANTILNSKPGAKVAVLEAADRVAPPVSQSASNSNVVHAGVYYAPGSLKAKYCTAGKRWTEEFCRENNILFEKCGKLIVATTPKEVERLDTLHERALKNGLEIEVLPTPEAIREREPNITGLKAIFVKDSAITDYPAICEKLSEKIEEKGGSIYLRAKVNKICEFEDTTLVFTEDSRGFTAKNTVICGGVQSDRLGKMAGFDIDFRIIPFRGEYYILPDEMGDITKALIYPVPDPDMPFLGVHLTRTIDGKQTVGPNAVVGFDREKKRKLSINVKDSLDIATFPGSWKLAGKFAKTAVSEQWDSLVKRSYIKRVKKYSPSVEVSHLKPYPCGIRAQAVKADGSMIEDFDIRVSDKKRMILCVNVPSPAATSAHPISEHIVKILEEDCVL